MAEYSVEWSIAVEADSPEEAAEHVWTNIMRRDLPALPDDACVFTITNRHGRSVEIDLVNNTNSIDKTTD